MKRILFIASHRLDRAPGQRFRFEQYLNYLEENGFVCTLSSIISESDDKIFYSKNKFILKIFIVIKSIFIRIKDVRRAKKFDIVFIYREAFILGSIIFEKLFKRSGAKIIFDFDDAIWLKNMSPGNENINWLKKPEKTLSLIQIADMVFAGNNYLANFAKKYNPAVKIIPTTINTDYHLKKTITKNSKICIGWTGTSTTIEYYKTIIPALIEVYKKYETLIKFKVIVDIEFNLPEISLISTAWKYETEIEDLSEIDIGIMPLPDDKWSKGKCGFKGLQYMALEIPTIMSPVGVNTEIIQDGENGFLANSQEEWVEKISLLIESKELCEKLGKAGRDTVIKKYSFESQKDRYIQFFTELINS